MLREGELRALADILRLYDPDRLREPVLNGSPSTWEKAGRDRAGSQGMSERRAGVLLITDAVVSPTRAALIRDLKRALPYCDTLPGSRGSPCEAAATRAIYGEALLPRFRFDRADVILSLQADFLESAARFSAYAELCRPPQHFQSREAMNAFGCWKAA